ncbi:MAG: hypothetical protein KHW93_07540 [Butyricicoccus pullicaecorum]|nr:hypothetical protein [Butyricicoccus pullicaecorum]
MESGYAGLLSLLWGRGREDMVPCGLHAPTRRAGFQARGIHSNLILSEVNEKSTNKRRFLGPENKKLKWILGYFG